ncbi:laminin subunit alpha-1 isoform X2 [Phyllopteryx taeniolatus]|uniref:laminin subunit alpha-1 isoform X2 n=1 Tax=Phyllopteryx taeniolatus TaxID=161469 RepID=UPI002AD24EC2|nr:laminin subunit alpha-1 isoform X2 [Phyllopteryx taeniolatus]
MSLLVLLLLMQQTASQQRGLFPAILNLASNAEITSNATCGDPEAEVYCKLVEHVPGRLIKNPHCPKCDGNSILSKERHPITNAIDGTNHWWQSPSIKNGRQFHWVTITLDLKQIFQVAYIIIKAANSPRPGNWILERSMDGLTFEPWQFYAISDSECLSRYNITPRLGPPTYKSDTEVICTSYYSRLEPLEHGEIHTSLINSRPGADDLTSELLNFTSARFIQLRLQRIRTLNADLMTLSAHDPREIDPIVTRRYYYSIKDISVGGMCICYGHARSCPLDPVTKKLQCVCEHNTCGVSCNHCCPGYHQQPWQPGTISEGNTCQKCNCHKKASDCFYNQTVADLRLSVNIHGVRHGGGVCIDCQQNTAGINCETCADRYFRPEQVSPDSESPCVECDCHLRGAESSICTRDDTLPGASAGQCACKNGFAGRRCDRCAFGFRDFPLCARCECNLAGNINKDPCDDCICKANVMGGHCDLCKAGFYNLQAANPLGCTDCFCFGVSDVCESSTWSVGQVVSTNAQLHPPSSLHLSRAILGNDLPTSGNASFRHQKRELSWEAPASFLGNKLSSYGGLLNYSVVYHGSLDIMQHFVPVHTDVIIQGNGQALRLSPPHILFLSPLAERSVAIEMLPDQFVDQHTGVQVSRDDLLSVFAEVTSVRVKVHLNTSTSGAMRLVFVSLDVADSQSASGVQAVAMETCECPWGYSGTSCESCLPGFYRVGGVLFGGNCMQCECNDHASECDVNGVCLGCSHHTIGPHCNQCLPGFYGDATEGTADDCRRCPCPLTEASNSFSPTCVLGSSGLVSCDQCQEGYTGSKCHKCSRGFYGNPQVVGGTCVRCQCNNNVDTEEVGHCDAVSGECRRCRHNTAGRHCEMCAAGFYGDAVHQKNCQECNCDVNGSWSSVCDVTSGQCACRDNVTGRACDLCQPGFFGLRSGSGCVACDCNLSGSPEESCDDSGRCRCVDGVDGDKCDRCGRGYFRFRADGCTACTCKDTGGNCHHQTGECICPAHTEGDTCDMCETGYWGQDPITGCKPCNCSAEGSSASQCDLTNGQCLCREGFSGRSCDLCAPGSYGYPACSPCGCDVAGTKEDSCSRTLGVCDCQHTGKCVCKVAAVGRHCEKCISGFFALSSDNPDGCSPCFCSGLSRDCEAHAGLTGALITMARSPALLPLVSQSDLEGVISGVYQQGGDMLLDTRQLNTSRLRGPLYWRLPSQFEGQQLLSYGGVLSYVITFYVDDAGGLENQEPQVLMRGGALRKLLIYTEMVAPDNGIRTQHDIRLTEHKWRYFNSVSEKAVSHSDFLSVLSDLQYILVKASYGTRLQQSRISNITMETAVKANESQARTGAARPIESCSCPPGYAGMSCQECAAGFFRQPLWELPPQAQKSAFVRLCVACHCNNHSSSCHADSGHCQECQHHTSGPSCELCAQGYYGKVSGSIRDCSLCACPLQDNSFSPTCVSEGNLGDFRCTSCLTGYEGRYCEQCSQGYYGNPSLPGGMCTPCSCSGWGSLHQLCDPLTGQCQCKAGVKGPMCERCNERHVLEGNQCVSCDEECTGALLNDLDQMHRRWQAVNISSVAIAPYRQLLALNKQTRDMQLMFSERISLDMPVSRVEEDSMQLTSDLSVLLKQATNVSSGWEGVGVSNMELGVFANDSLSLGSRLIEMIIRIQVQIEALEKEAGQLTGAADVALELASRTRLLDQMTSILESMRAVNLTTATNLGRQELSLSESLVSSLQLLVLPSSDNRLRPLTVGLTAHIQKLQEAQTRVEDAAKENVQTHLVLNATNALISHYQATYQNVSVACVCVENMMEARQLLLNNVVNATEELANIAVQTEMLGGELDQWCPLLRKKVEALVIGLKSTDSLERVYRAERRTHLLQNHALSLHSSLSSLWNASQNSSQLVVPDANVTDSVSKAWRVASDAHKSADLAFNMTNQSAESGARLSAISAVLSESHLIKTAEDLHLTLSVVTTKQQILSNRVHSTSVLLHQPIKELQSLSNGSLQLQEAQLQAALAHSSLQEALQHLYTLRQQLWDSSSVVEKTNLSVAETNQLMTHTHSAANEARRKLEEAEHRTQQLSDKIKPLSMLGENLSRNLSDIRELIEQARRQAASIKVAVQADEECVRSYRPQIQSSNFNTLTLTLKTKRPNNLLFYMGSKTTVEFLAVEMHNGKVSLLWDIGSGSTRLEYPGLDITNNRWTRINATRLGARGFLSIYQLEAAPSQTVTATSPGPARVLQIDNSTVIHIGGLADDTQRPAALQWSTFNGCLGEASLNEKNVGLWNYVSRRGQCGGCFSSPQAEETSFHFDGSGFSLIQKSLRATSTSIVLLFKTLSPAGLLLYLASNNTRDFLSIELVEGCVRLTFDLGSGPLVLTSSRKYNNGVWYKVTLQRNRRKGHLSIMAADQSSEKEVLEAESPGSASDLNRFDLDPIYIGGLPASRPIRRQVVSRSYIGCIKNVEIARLNFDLLRDAYGVRKGCVLEAVRSVSMLSSGFVQIAPRSLGQEAEILFSFKSNNQSGVLLAAFTDNHAQRRHFLSVHLLSGSLEVELGETGADGRRVTVTAAEGGSFTDGTKHSVIVNVNRKSLSVQVDEGKVKSASLLPGGLSRLSTASFFIGGLPSGDEAHLPIRLQKISKLFRGCIQHLVLGALLVDLSAAVKYEGAELDSCLLEEKVRGAVLPEDQDVEPTLDPSHLSVAPPTHLTPVELTCTPEKELRFLPTAAQFGSSRHSHMTFTIEPVTVRKSVTLRLSLRTRARDGLLLLLSDGNQMDFAILRLAAGRPLMSADLGKGAATAASSVAVNDGKWHTVSADVSRRSVSVSVDASAPDLVAVKGNQLDVNSRLYLGGLPRAHNTRRINVTTSLPGCVHSVSLNGVMLDLSRPASRNDVTSCFSKEESGSYFNGSGYAALMPNGYKVGSDVSVSLEFRTSRSDGVFLGISSAKVDAVGLEMIKGQVVFNVNNGAGRVWVASASPVLCDGRWHRLLARKTKHTLSLSIDGRSNSISNPYPQSTSAETNNPVYVGGYPDGVKQNCLSIKSAFRGCLKNVHLIKSHLNSPLDMSQAHFSLGVTPNSCPAA